MSLIFRGFSGVICYSLNWVTITLLFDSSWHYLRFLNVTYCSVFFIPQCLGCFITHTKRKKSSLFCWRSYLLTSLPTVLGGKNPQLLFADSMWSNKTIQFDYAWCFSFLSLKMCIVCYCFPMTCNCHKSNIYTVVQVLTHSCICLLPTGK